MIEIPLSSYPEQIFDITLGGVVYSFRVSYNTRSNVWTADISRNQTALVSGLTLLGGVDLTAHINIPIRNLFLVNLENPNVNPTDSNLGGSARLFVVPEVEDEQTV